jgi:hypothetical protein
MARQINIVNNADRYESKISGRLNIVVTKNLRFSKNILKTDVQEEKKSKNSISVLLCMKAKVLTFFQWRSLRKQFSERQLYPNYDINHVTRIETPFHFEGVKQIR